VKGASRGACALALLCALSACAGLLQSSARPEQTYYLRAPAAASTAAEAGAGAEASAAAPPPLGVSVRVGHPLAAPGLDSPHIMLVQADHRMNFFAGSRWAAPAPDVVEALAVQTLRASGVWASVEDTASPFPSDYLLQITLRRFDADYTEGAATPVVHVALDCIIGRVQGREVLATFSAAGSAPTSANRLHEVIAAFEQASGSALQALAQQAAQAVRTDAQRPTQNADSPAPSIRRPSQ
jgi:cholesterol transport system auxiliary component